nr:M23 family metallopeptidase [Bacteroidota bacterium]
GMPVYAIGDGYISRIKISAYGYGKALYITHPNGYVSVYAHLQSFESKIQTLTSTIHYAKEKFEIDTLLNDSLLPLRKGDFIGLSGNTGGSQGPHLHFEIRDAKTEMPVNPHLFGFFIPDTVKPRITKLAIYPLDENSRVNGKPSLRKIIPIHKKGKYSYLSTDTISVQGCIGLGIECYDTENKSSNQNGVYSIELRSGGRRIYYHEMKTFSFENARYVNAHIDYSDKEKNLTKIQKCFLSENNKAGIYKDVIDQGKLSFNDDSIHWMKFIVKDFSGNATELMLKIKSRSGIPSLQTKPQSGSRFDCSSENKYEDENIKIFLPADALYDDMDFNYSIHRTNNAAIQGHKIQNKETALQKPMLLSIKQTLPDSLQEKATIIRYQGEGLRMTGIHNEGGKYKDGWVSTETKSFGNFCVTLDTLAPKLKQAFKQNKDQPVQNLSKAKTLGIIARDDLTGIKKYRATIDGIWVLCEYEYKKDLLFHTFEKNLVPGIHNFSIEVTDDKGNTAVLMFRFMR